MKRLVCQNEMIITDKAEVLTCMGEESWYQMIRRFCLGLTPYVKQTDDK